MYEKLQFALQYLLHPFRNASVTPSSAFAARAMVSGIDFSQIEVIVELGPGTGVFTDEILKQCKPETKIILIEIEESYVALLREKFGSRVIVEQASAHLLETIVAKHTDKKVGLIISGLPVHLPAVKKALFAAIEKYTEAGAYYRFFSYLPPLVKHEYRELPIRKLSFVLRNVPPLWVYGIN